MPTELLATIHLLTATNARLVAARTFLILNGVDLDATQDDKALTFLSLAEGAISEEELAEWIRKRIHS